MAFADSVRRVDEACLRVFGGEVLYLPAAGGQAEVEIEGIRYKVFDIEADSEGAAVLRMRKTG